MSERVRLSRVAIVAWALVSLLSLLVWFRLQTTDAMSHLDLQVFHGAVGQLMGGGDLYSFAILDNGVPTPFLYPPFAALVFMSIAALPYEVATGVWDLLQLALVIVLLWLIGRGAQLSSSWVRRDATLILSWLLMLISIPVMAVLQLGQLGLILAVLVLVDVVVVPPKYRGLLTGLAGAIKLIPLIMLPYYLVTRQWRTASLSALSFGGATLIGFWALPAESVQYWTQYAWSTGRFPGIGTERNVSFLGLLQFAQVPGATVWWVATAAVVMGLGLWGAMRLYGVGEVAMAAILMGVVAGLISPVSWYHHLVWVPLAGAALVFRGRGAERVAGWVVLVCSSVAFGAAQLLLRQVFGSDLPVVAGFVVLQLGAGGALISHGVRARRSPAPKGQHVAA